MKKIFFLIFLSMGIFLFAGCAQETETCDINEGFSCDTTTKTLNLNDTRDAVIEAIQNTNLPELANFIGPDGVRFSPYEYVHEDTDVVLSKDLVHNGLTLSRSFMRGYYDSSGEPIDLGIRQYRENFVYDVDFAKAPEVYHNQKFERGNSINNIFDVYDGKEIFEYHFPGFDPQYDGMDRRSLYLVFDKIDEQRYLIGIIHDSRTI